MINTHPLEHIINLQFMPLYIAQVEAEVSDPVGATGPPQAQAAERESPNYEAMYNNLLASNRRMVHELQVDFELQR